MKCIFCGHLQSKVVDKRDSSDMMQIRRRRECEKCGKRFTTFEAVEVTTVLVVKNDGTRQSFDPQKIKQGIMKATEKRPITAKQIDAMVSNVQKVVQNSLKAEFPSSEIGKLVMEELKQTDEVAYIRFASVYRQFKDVAHFVDFIHDFESMIKK